MCMSEEFRPLQAHDLWLSHAFRAEAGGEARAPYDRELDKYRPLSPQASQGPEDLESHVERSLEGRAGAISAPLSYVQAPGGGE